MHQIRSANMARGRVFTKGKNNNEWLARITVGQCRVNLLRVAARIDGCEYASVLRQQMRDKRNCDRFSRGNGQFLVELGQMPVLRDIVGLKSFRNLGVQSGFAGRSSGTGHTGFQINYDVVGIDHFIGNQRQQRKETGRGIASGTSDQTRRRHLAAVKFCQPVDSFRQQFGARMRLTVPLLVEDGILEAEVR